MTCPIALRGAPRRCAPIGCPDASLRPEPAAAPPSPAPRRTASARWAAGRLVRGVRPDESGTPRHRSRPTLGPRPAKSARVLDIGSSPPLLLASMVADGWHASGIDIDPSRFAGPAAVLGFEVARCDIEHEPLPFADGAFDVVVMNEVFEHLRIDLIATMSEIARVLAPPVSCACPPPTPGLPEGSPTSCSVARRAGAAQATSTHSTKSCTRSGHMGHVREYTLREATGLPSPRGTRPGNRRVAPPRPAVGLSDRGEHAPVVEPVHVTHPSQGGIDRVTCWSDSRFLPIEPGSILSSNAGAIVTDTKTCPCCMAIRRRLRQLQQNLISNSVKYPRPLSSTGWRRASASSSGTTVRSGPNRHRAEASPSAASCHSDQRPCPLSDRHRSAPVAVPRCDRQPA